ncbi:MAG: STAS domain-containing protein [Lachnospiraceae bacterium]|nr:STAS domain-containing protein [Lachnospiraceae bacterium]
MEILEQMGVEKETIFHGVDRNDLINRPSDIVRELRYVALNRTIEESGLKTLMDLPCGYTPKVFEFTEKGMQYIGCDLPAVINDFSPIIASMTDDEQKKHIRFQVVDVTNYESMKAAADLADGPVCIATEGLTVYLTAEETRQLGVNIRRILSEKGGCWLNADVETLDYYMAVFKAVAGDRAMELLVAARKGFSGQSDTDLHKNKASVVKESGGKLATDYEKIEALYKSRGLLVEKVPYYRDDIKLKLFDVMTDEEIEKLKENMKHVNVWKITADPDFKEKENNDPEVSSKADTDPDPDLPFEVKSSLKDGLLEVSIQGRMDTITSPELLKQFQEAGEGITGIHIDVSRMAYVSSAGLRVLLIMYKSLEDKDKFKLTGVSSTVREIMETTGFDQFFLN